MSKTEKPVLDLKELPNPEKFWQSLAPWDKLLVLVFGRAISVGFYQLAAPTEHFFYRCRSCGRFHVDYRQGYAELLHCTNIKDTMSKAA